jgi:hypothetical protein
LGSPFFPPMVVEMMWPVTGSPPSSRFCTTRKKNSQH